MDAQTSQQTNSPKRILSPEKPTQIIKEIKCVDLFCGCGGMSLGFQNVGFDILAAFDNWKPAVEVYKANFAHPVNTVNLGELESQKLIRQLKPQLIIGGPPCQDFSSAGPSNFLSSRAGLAESFVDIVECAMPRFFVLENVPRIRITPIFSTIESRFKALGYGLTKRVLDASYCGVPQTRKRLFLIGELGAEDGFLEDYLERHLSYERLTMRKYFGDALDTEFYFRVPTNYSRRGVFSVDEPSMTIRAVDRPIPNGYPTHPEDPVTIGPEVRALTILERSYVQTFPPSFAFRGNKTDLNKMIGNAVPVKLAEFVARALKEYIREADAK